MAFRILMLEDCPVSVGVEHIIILFIRWFVAFPYPSYGWVVVEVNIRSIFLFFEKVIVKKTGQIFDFRGIYHFYDFQFLFAF